MAYVRQTTSLRDSSVGLHLISALLFLVLADTVYSNDTGTPLYCSDQKRGCKTEVDITAGQLTSVESVLTFTPQKLGLCLFSDSELGFRGIFSRIAGNGITRSNIKMPFGKAQTRGLICTQTISGTEQANVLMDLIRDQFSYHLMVDDIPVSTCYQLDDMSRYCMSSFPVGCSINEEGFGNGYCIIYGRTYLENSLYLINHFSFEVEYEPVPLTPDHGKPSTGDNNTEDMAGRIVMVTVQPKSRRMAPYGRELVAEISALKMNETLSISFTYDVTWKKVAVQIRQPLVHLLSHNEFNIYLVSTANSVFMVLVFGLSVLLILLRSHPRFLKLHLCLKRLGGLCTVKRLKLVDEDGWQQVSKDALRAPCGRLMLAALCGNSTQLLLSFFLTLAAELNSIIGPGRGERMIKWFLWSYGVSGLGAGFVSRHLCFYLPGASKEEVNMKSLLAVFCRSWLVSGFLLCIFFGLNLIHWTHGSSAALDAESLCMVSAFILCLPVPFWFVGSLLSSLWTASRINMHILPEVKPESSDDNNSPPSRVPRQPCFMWWGVCLLLQGFCPFTCIYIPTSFFLSSAWSGLYMKIEGILVVMALLMVSCTICCSCWACVFQLCKHNYLWWWRSMLAGAGLAVLFFLFTVHFFFAKMSIPVGNAASAAPLFFGYSLLIAIVIFLVTGPPSFICAFLFVTRLYYNLQLSRCGGELLQNDADTTTEESSVMSAAGRSECVIKEKDLNSFTKDEWDSSPHDRTV